MGRFQSSIQIAKDSFAVLKREKELTAIPVMSFVVTLVTLAVVGGAIFLTLDVQDVVDRTAGGGTSTEYNPTPVTYAVGVIGYLLVTFVVTFFAGAMVSGAHQALTGGSTSLGQAINGATKRIGPLFAWAMLTGTVGLVLQIIQERVGILGDIAARIVGMAWQIVTWLAVPVVIVEGTGPIPSLKRSASLFKQTWGENLIAQGGFGLLGLLVMIPALLVSGLVFRALPLLGIVLGVLSIGLISALLSSLNGIYRTALYLYATDNQVPAGYDQAAMQGAFKVKTGRFR